MVTYLGAELVELGPLAVVRSMYRGLRNEYVYICGANYILEEVPENCQSLFLKVFPVRPLGPEIRMNFEHDLVPKLLRV